MCYGVTCPECSKKAWRGCGNHINSAMDGVPEDQWCTCGPRVDFHGKKYPPAARIDFPGYSWLMSLVGGGSSGSKTTAGKGKDEL